MKKRKLNSKNPKYKGIAAAKDEKTVKKKVLIKQGDGYGVYGVWYN